MMSGFITPTNVQIPGIHLMNVEVSPVSSSNAVQLTTFKENESFTIPTAHRVGKCRLFTEFERISVIGEGTFGTVYKVKDKVNGHICALKRLKIQRDTELMPLNFLREISNLKLLKHENIVNLLDVAVGKHFESTYLVIEFCEYSLSTIIDDAEADQLLPPQVKSIMKQMFTGLDYIHKNFVLHRDISPPNILFTDTGVLKITDFGLSRKTPPGNATPNVGLRWYKAPELLFGAINYTSTIDIWSSGCIFGEILLRRVLFRGDSDSEVIRLIIDFLGTPTETLWPGYSLLPVPQLYELRFQPFNRIRSSLENESQATISLMQKVLIYNPSLRPSAEQCLQHTYFSEPPAPCTSTDLLRILKSTKYKPIQVIA